MGVIIAPPSSMKTMVIQLFRKYPNSFYTDSFTPSSLVSHNASLTEEQLQKIDMMPKMKDRLVLVPELAPIFTAKDDDLQKMMGIITRVLDGHGLENDSGAQGHRKYDNTMFVLLGAVVEIPPRVWKLLGTLGHKIYFYRPALRKKSIKDLIEIAESNNFSANNKEIEEALLDYLKTFDAAPEVKGKINLENGIIKVRWKEEVKDEQAKSIRYIAQLANLLASLRGEVFVSPSKFANNKNNYSGDDIQQQEHQQPPRQTYGQDYDTDIPIKEDPSRAVILLRNLLIGRAISQGRDRITIDDVKIAIKVALSTAPVRRVRILDLLLKSETGVLTTSQICSDLSISQPVVTRTMREFDALGIADISSVSQYSNSELQIKLNREFEWFRTNEFLDLKGDFVPYEKKYNENEENDFDKQPIDSNSITEDNNENHFDKNAIIDDSIIQNEERVSLLENKEQHDINSDAVETVEPCDNNKDCHTLKENLPPETQQENNDSSIIYDNSNHIAKQAENHYHHKQQKYDDADLQHLSNNNNNNESQDDNHNNKQIKTTTSSNTPDGENAEKSNPSLWGSKSFERVTMSQENQNIHTPNQNSLPFKEKDDVKDPAFDIALQEILNITKLANGSTIAVNSAIETAHRNNESVRNYLGEKLTSRENRKVRDLNLAIIRHPNIEVVKYKPQLLVRWQEDDRSAVISKGGEMA